MPLGHVSQIHDSIVLWSSWLWLHTHQWQWGHLHRPLQSRFSHSSSSYAQHTHEDILRTQVVSSACLAVYFTHKGIDGAHRVPSKFCITNSICLCSQIRPVVTHTPPLLGYYSRTPTLHLNDEWANHFCLHGAKASSKSIPCFCTYPFTTSMALCFNILPYGSLLTLKSHLIPMGFRPSGSSARVYFWFFFMASSVTSPISRPEETDFFMLCFIKSE